MPEIGHFSYTFDNRIFGGLAGTTEKGSRNYIHAVLTDTSPGAFINCCRERAPATLVTNKDGQKVQKKFFDESIKLYRSMATDEQLGLA